MTRLLAYAPLAALLALLACGRNASPTTDMATVTGAATYRARIALPPTARLIATLEDVSRADAPAAVLAADTVALGGRQVPIPFTLRYDADEIEPRNRYSLRAVIEGPNGELMWTSTTAAPVITNGAPTSDLEIVLEQARTSDSGGGASAKTANLAGRTWVLDQLTTPDGGAVRPADGTSYTLTFEPDDRVAGQVDCNRFFGGYELGNGRAIAFDKMGATRKACPPKGTSLDYLGQLGKTERYAVRAGRLSLMAADGTAAVFVEQSGDANGAGSGGADGGGADGGGADGGGAMLPQPAGKAYRWTCPDGGPTFRTKNGPGELALWLPEELGGDYYVLGQVRAASGARYRDGEVEVWAKGREARLTLGDEVYPACIGEDI